MQAIETTSRVLTSTEAGSLAKAEKVIREGLDTFVSVGTALMEIRDGRLYRELFDTFEDYCQDKWKMSRRYINLLIGASAVVANLGTIDPKPENEAQARPLTRLEPEQQREAWQRVVATAPDGKVTASLVERVVREFEGVAIEMEGVPAVTADEPEPTIEVIREEKPEPAPAPDYSHIIPADAVTVDDLDKLIAAGQKFGCIYADPPWQYGNQATRASTDNHYPTMPLDAICALPVAQLAADAAHLHLWTTNGFLFDAKRVIEAWGFEFRSVRVWCKPQMGIGNYWRVSHEFLLTAIRGDAKRFNNNSMMSWVMADRMGHSAKPESFREDVEKVSGGPYLELFGRKTVPGWTVWGNQISRSIFDVPV